ncbi:MAG: filamentous hemagglutinin N-terminal domain-containing protein [Spirulina sp. SIO3F2]|nr:filamentous hemagglutinin N-terminal domain-containing protein [Spirulina sp. SIO3F2]
MAKQYGSLWPLWQTLGGIIGGYTISISGTALAQTVTADGTVGTTVTGSGPFTIIDGTIQGNNLFHSFTDFSPGTATAQFDLTHASYGGAASGITAIINRVTGGNISNIDGLLQVLGGNSPDFFLINPNGIVLGPNAELDMNGSFIGSTASSIVFPNNIAFSASDTTVAPLLTINRPTGLVLSTNVASITASSSTTGLNMAPGETFGLLGGNVTLNGSTVTAPAGRIELGAVLDDATVTLSEVSDGWTFDDATISGSGDVRLEQATLALVGDGGGNLNIQGQNITATDGTFINSVMTGSQNGGTMQLKATNTVEFDGGSSLFPDAYYGAGNASAVVISANTLRMDQQSYIWSYGYDAGLSADITVTAKTIELLDRSVILTLALSNGDSGDISVSVDTIDLQGGSQIGPGTFGSGDTGNLTVRASTAILADGAFSLAPNVTSGFYVNSEAGSTGNSGNIDVETQQIVLSNGGTFINSTLGAGNAGEVKVTADTIDIMGNSANGVRSGIFTQADERSLSTTTGSGGKINLNVRQLTLQDGGEISASTFGPADAGTIAINANEIQISGTDSSISSESFNAGNAGSIRLNTDRLTVANAGAIAVSGTGTGSAGNIEVNARTIYLNNNGVIRAESVAGDQGNIALNASEILLLRNRGLISTNATDSATGGNITINAPVIAGYENSDITANAILGSGGSIKLTTQGIFGLAFRDQLTPDNDITASSQFGVSGTITVNEFSLDPSSGLMALVVALGDTSDQMDAACTGVGNSEFIATGKGGISPAPDAQSGGIVGPWQDIRNLRAFLSTTVNPPSTIAPSPPTLQEATGFQPLSNGQIALVAEPGMTHNQSHYATCAMGGFATIGDAAIAPTAQYR